MRATLPEGRWPAVCLASRMAERVACSAAINAGGWRDQRLSVERIYRDVRVCQIYEGLLTSKDAHYAFLAA